jgi:hypothetical protein
VDQAPISVQVNASDETKIWLVESESQGSLADIKVGDKVVVRGTRAEGSTKGAPAVDAKHIAVGPRGPSSGPGGPSGRPPTDQSSAPISGSRRSVRHS